MTKSEITVPATSGNRLLRQWRRVKKWWPVYLMMLPGAAYLIINNYIPMTGIVVAFKKYNVQDGIWGSRWVGLQNFEYLFTSKDAWIMTRNTLLYNLAFLVINNVLGILTAILITEVNRKRFRHFFQSMVLVPFVLSIVIISYIVFAFLSADGGILNHTILPALGLDEVDWYNSPQYWPFILVIVNAWKGVGYGSMIYIAGITGIDKGLYEAAELDGAGKMRQILNVTLPSLVPSIITLCMLSIGRIFYSDFGLFYQVPMNSGTLYSVTNVIDTQVYRMLITVGNIGMSSASGFYQSIVGFILVFMSNMLVRKISADNALF